MAVKIRLQRKGRKKAPFYHIVVADARSPRDGRFIEKLGIYNPIAKPAIVELDMDKAFNWLMQGAQPTDTVNAILRYKGVLHRKHLQRGVSKGALTQEQADSQHLSWLESKESSIALKVEARKQEMADFHKKMSGVAKAAKIVEEVAAVEAPAEVPDETPADTAQETPAENVEETPAEQTEAATDTPSAENE